MCFLRLYNLKCTYDHIKILVSLMVATALVILLQFEKKYVVVF